jgi:flagellar hook-length control protein FliK
VVPHITASEIEPFSETLTAARPGTGLLVEGGKLSLHDPVAAKELIQTQSTQEFDRMLDQIVKQVSLNRKGETFQLGVRLKPEFLGELRIETILEADKTMRAVIRVEDPSVRALMEGKVTVLVQRFDEAGIHVDKVEIQSLPPDSGSSHDTSKDRQGWGQQANSGKGSPLGQSELDGQIEDENEEDFDDGHIHLFI